MPSSIQGWLRTLRTSDAKTRLPDHVQQLADLKSALDHAAIVATTDVRGRITYVNDKFVDISGYSREELLGQDHRIVNSGHHPKEFIRDLWVTIANGRVWHGGDQEPREGRPSLLGRHDDRAVPRRER